MVGLFVSSKGNLMFRMALLGALLLGAQIAAA